MIPDRDVQYLITALGSLSSGYSSGAVITRSTKSTAKKNTVTCSTVVKMLP